MNHLEFNSVVKKIVQHLSGFQELKLTVYSLYGVKNEFERALIMIFRHHEDFATDDFGYVELYRETGVVNLRMKDSTVRDIKISEIESWYSTLEKGLGLT